ncbi:MAG: hypothetical protein K6A91_02150 [Clostridia bacterium]|nr:hypothetical protein [Clostridia bacterium]
MEIFSREELDKQKAGRKRAMAAMIAVSAAAVVFCIVLFCIVDPLNEKLCRILAAAAVSAAGCFDIYVCGYILPYIRPDQFYKPGTGKVVKVLRNLLRQLLLYLMCIILASILTTFIFNRITDTSPQHKVAVFIDVPSVKSAELQTVLDEDLPEGIKMTKVHTFNYDMFGYSGGDEADIYIVAADRIGEFIDYFAPVSEFLPPRSIYQYYVHDGVPYGVLVKGGGYAASAEYISYEEGKEYYLFFRKGSVHPGPDGASAYIAERLMTLK